MIKTERLTLRPFREGDAADVFEYLSGPQPHCFECMKVPFRGKNGHIAIATNNTVFGRRYYLFPMRPPRPKKMKSILFRKKKDDFEV